jgi:adenosine deaminase
MNPVAPTIRVDRHTHLEGALDPAWVRSEALRRDLPLPKALEALWAGRTAPFQGFIEAFLFGASLLDSREAVHEAVLAVVRRTLEAGGAGVDLWVSPHFLVAHRGQISLEAFWRGLEGGLWKPSSGGSGPASWLTP